MEEPGDEVRLPVMKPPESVVNHGRTLGTTVISGNRVNSVNEMQEAMKTMANVGKDSSAMSVSTFWRKLCGLSSWRNRRAQVWPTSAF